MEGTKTLLLVVFVVFLDVRVGAGPVETAVGLKDEGRTKTYFSYYYLGRRWTYYLLYYDLFLQLYFLYLIADDVLHHKIKPTFEGSRSLDDPEDAYASFLKGLTRNLKDFRRKVLEDGQ